MQCSMDAIPATAIEPGGVAPTQTEFSVSNIDFFPSLPFFRSKSSRVENILSGPLASQKDGVLVLRNKAPRWHEQLQCWCLNFHGRVTVASVKNFQLVASPENGPTGPQHEKIILQFGKVGKDLFTMDYRYPISAFQAFAICLSSFDTKIACEWHVWTGLYLSKAEIPEFECSWKTKLQKGIMATSMLPLLFSTNINIRYIAWLASERNFRVILYKLMDAPKWLNVFRVLRIIVHDWHDMKL